jgi:hypothetical protein
MLTEPIPTAKSMTMSSALIARTQSFRSTLDCKLFS